MGRAWVSRATPRTGPWSGWVASSVRSGMRDRHTSSVEVPAAREVPSGLSGDDVGGWTGAASTAVTRRAPVDVIYEIVNAPLRCVLEDDRLQSESSRRLAVLD